MSQFQVNFVIKNWVTIVVDADNKETAREKAKTKFDKLHNSKNQMGCIDGKSVCLGCLNESEIDVD